MVLEGDELPQHPLPPGGALRVMVAVDLFVRVIREVKKLPAIFTIKNG